MIDLREVKSIYSDHFCTKFLCFDYSKGEGWGGCGGGGERGGSCLSDTDEVVSAT